MVSTENLHIFGITCSLAWQLPHKSVFQEEHTEAAMHDTRISVSNITKKLDQNDQKQSASPPQTAHRHFDTYFKRTNYHLPKIDNNYYGYLKTKQTHARPPLNKENVQNGNWEKYRTNKVKWNYSHDVYPALRMRRHISNHSETIHDGKLHPEVKSLLIYHRNTRFDLYKSIELYLNA